MFCCCSTKVRFECRGIPIRLVWNDDDDDDEENQDFGWKSERCDRIQNEQILLPSSLPKITPKFVTCLQDCKFPMSLQLCGFGPSENTEVSPSARRAPFRQAAVKPEVARAPPGGTGSDSPEVGGNSS